jgi:naphthoate synthase
MAVSWTLAGASYTDIRYETTGDPVPGIANHDRRPEVRNAFRPQTVIELSGTRSSAPARTPTVGVVVLTGEGPLAFCSAATSACAATTAT